MNIKKSLIKNLIVNKLPTIQMYRVEFGTHRLYAEQNPFDIYSGLTGALSATTFKGDMDSKILTKWRDKMLDTLGKEATDAYVNSTADFGTLTHEALLRIWNTGFLVWEDEYQIAQEYFRQSALSNGLAINENIIESQVFEYCKSVSSLMYFINEKVADIYAIEAMCKSTEHHIATPVDLVCKLKGKGEIVTVNIKTSNQFSDKQREQVVMEKYMWNLTYPDCQADKTALLRPKDWNTKKEPTYEFEIVDEKNILDILLKKLPLALASEKTTYLKFPKSFMEFTGITKLGESPKFKTIGLEEKIFPNGVEL